MSRFSGQQDFTGPKRGRKNKGVLAAFRTEKRLRAEALNEARPHEETIAHKNDRCACNEQGTVKTKAPEALRGPKKARKRSRSAKKKGD